MSKVYTLYQHAGSGNHGCEALVRTVVDLIRCYDENGQIVLVSSNIEEDIRYGLDKIENLQIVKLNKNIKKGNWNWIKLQLAKLLKNEKMQMNAVFHLKWAERIEDNLFIAIGGDNYCYEKGKNFYALDNYIKGKKILWGCSIEPDDMDYDMVEHLKQFNMITAREHLTYNALAKKGITKLCYIPDTAFLLETIEQRNVKNVEYIGINISPLIFNYCSNIQLIYENYVKLLKYIIGNTNYEILLIPHVVCDNNDDRRAISRLLEKVNLDSERIHVIKDCSCRELKGYIKNCKIFIGARTHATIAAYSQGIPTVVVGYSVKSRGIAEDLFGTCNQYVVSVNAMKSEDELQHCFVRMLENYEQEVASLKCQSEKMQFKIEREYRKVLKEVVEAE